MHGGDRLELPTGYGSPQERKEETKTSFTLRNEKNAGVTNTKEKHGPTKGKQGAKLAVFTKTR